LNALHDLSQMALLIGESSRVNDIDGIVAALLEMESLSIGTHRAAIDEVKSVLEEAESSRRLFKSVQIFWSAIKATSPAIRRVVAERSETGRKGTLVKAVHGSSRGLEMSFFEPGSVFMLFFAQSYSDKFPRVSTMDELLHISSGVSSLLFFTAEFLARSAGASWHIRSDERAPGHLTFVISYL
ncbi:MAG: hypothetical protein PHC51_09585, partial [bacterium]|nr:hypothetical protein [bacterium]